ncbi:type I restriction endonuclease [Candidatus Woesearchaeota archaeon]|nr:type I restriction endonuclease [Candidatus Woesearchaeota archaeon]
MTDEELKQLLLEVVKKHLNVVKSYDPYYRFPSMNTKEDFIQAMKDDPAFMNFNLDTRKYTTARFGGNLITSLHRKLGDLYEECVATILKEKVPGVSEQDAHWSVRIIIDDREQVRSTDGAIFLDKLEGTTKTLIEGIINRLKQTNPIYADKDFQGLAFEVRSCYQIGDSKRIQADEHMAKKLLSIDILPIMLVFCNTSLRSPVARLKHTWSLHEGNDSFDLFKEITNFDLFGFLEENKEEIQTIMNQIYETM